MRRLRLIALGLGLLALTACSHGMQLENGERPVQPITRISFLFTEGQSDIVLNTPEAPAQRDAAPTPAQVPPPAVSPTTAPTAAPSPSQPTQAPTADPTPLPEVDIATITANETARSLVIPASEVDPGLEIIDEESDPSDFLSEELMAQSGLVSFFVSGSTRQPSGGAGTGRPVQLVQRLFVHANAEGASRMFEELVDSAAPTFAIAALGFFRQFYPDLEPGTRTSDQFTLADQNRLIEVRIDPKIEPEERELGPGDPHIYYLILRQGRVSAIFELVYLSVQDPGVVTVLGERLINRIPSNLAESQS
ncbi:MAG: hypothetical protein OXR64_07545 [Chloroflexota bacterium]|nr:hypothetical protein [Chloroflexota bacterium]MDE2919682.1 hypothetical protein [Chloroflexota bacterium]